MDNNYSTFPSQAMKGPNDRHKTVYTLFYYTGLFICFPYTMVITMTGFWNYKLRDTSLPYNTTDQEQLNDDQKQFPNQLAMAGNLPLTIVVLITLFLGHLLTLQTRLLSSLVVQVICISGILLLAVLDSDEWQSTFSLLTLILMAVFASANALYQTSFLGNLGRFPPNYIGGANDGLGLGTILPALVAVLVLALDPPPSVLGVAGISTSLACVLLQLPVSLFLSTSSFYQHYSGGVPQRGPSPADFLTAWTSTWGYQTAVLLNYTVTLSVHPAVTALVRPASSLASPWHDKYFVPVCCFLTQALGDWLGRTLATASQWPRPATVSEVGVFVATALRAGFIPLFMFCNVAPGNRVSAILLPYDWVYVAILIVFSVSGGFLSNVCWMLAPQKVVGELQEVVCQLLLTCLVVGLGVGSLLGPLVVGLL